MKLKEKAVREKKGTSEIKDDYNEWFQSLIEDSPVMICRYLHDSTLTYVNKTFCDFFNAKSRQLIGKKWIEFVPEEKKSRIVYALSNFNQSMAPKKFENVLQLVNGETKYAEWVNSPVFNKAGIFQNEYQAIGTDVTKHVKTQNKYVLTNSRLFTLIDSIHSGVLVEDEERKIVLVNKQFCQLFNIPSTPSKLVGTDCNKSAEASKEYFTDPILFIERIKQILAYKKPVVNEELHLVDGRIFERDYLPIVIDKDYNGHLWQYRDVTEIKRAEELLNQGEKSYRGLFNAVSDAIYIQDRNGNFIDVNEGAEKMYGYNRKDFVGRTPGFLSAPDKNDIQLVVESLNKTFETGKPTFFEFWGLKKNGEIFPKEVMLNKGTYFGQEVIIAIGRDTTDRYKIQEVLRESETNLRAIFENTIQMFLLVENNHRIKSFNPIALEFSRKVMKKEFKVNEPFENYLSDSDVNNVYKLIEESLKGHKINFVRKFTSATNENFYLDINLSPVHDKNGKVAEVLFTVQDITNRIAAEEALDEERQLFIGGPVITIKWIADETSQVEYISPNVSTTLGFSPKDFTSNKINFYSLVHPDDINRIREEVHTYKRSGITSYQQEYRLRDKYGVYHWYFDFTRIVRDSDGYITHYHGYLFDITARKEAEKALMQSEQQLRNLIATKDKFFSIVAHDLRSPFQGLLGMSNILVDEDEDLTTEERNQFLKKLDEGLKAQYRLLDDLLAWSRVQRGVIEYNPELNDLAADIQEVIIFFNNSLEKKKLKIEHPFNESLMINYDKNIIATVVRNLLSNAIKFSYEGNTIYISATNSSNEIVVSIKDTGFGISKENADKLFKIDSHFSMLGTMKEGGTGLGLILCKELIEKHGGKIWVESELDKGSIFYFSIPKN